jgi:hypothetical protein
MASPTGFETGKTPTSMHKRPLILALEQQQQQLSVAHARLQGRVGCWVKHQQPVKLVAATLTQ